MEFEYTYMLVLWLLWRRRRRQQHNSSAERRKPRLIKKNDGQHKLQMRKRACDRKIIQLIDLEDPMQTIVHIAIYMLQLDTRVVSRA